MTFTVAIGFCPLSARFPIAVFTFAPCVTPVSVNTIEQDPGCRLSAPACVSVMEVEVVVTVPSQVLELREVTTKPAGKLSVKPDTAPNITAGVTSLVKVNVSSVV